MDVLVWCGNEDGWRDPAASGGRTKNVFFPMTIPVNTQYTIKESGGCVLALRVKADVRILVERRETPFRPDPQCSTIHGGLRSRLEMRKSRDIVLDIPGIAQIHLC